MSSESELNNSVLLYGLQLQQIQEVLKNCTNDEDRNNLKGLESDLQELINLAKLQNEENISSDDNTDNHEYDSHEMKAVT